MVKSRTAVYILVTVCCLGVASLQPADAVVEGLGPAASRIVHQPLSLLGAAVAPVVVHRGAPAGFRTTSLR